MSIRDPIKDEARGATNHIFFLSASNMKTSINWAIRNAIPEPAAILIEIRSIKLVEKKSVINTPKKKPRYTIFFATAFPYLLFDKSVIKKAIGYVNAPYVNIFSKLK